MGSQDPHRATFSEGVGAPHDVKASDADADAVHQSLSYLFRNLNTYLANNNKMYYCAITMM
jgi:hypothetical protein